MSQFQPLVQKLNSFFDKPFSAIPIHLAELVEDIYYPIIWDNLNPSKRHEIAATWDFDNDPATEPLRVLIAQAADIRLELEQEIEQWTKTATPTAQDLQTQKSRIQQLKATLSKFTSSLKKKLNEKKLKSLIEQYLSSKEHQATLEPAETSLKEPSTSKQQARKAATQVRHMGWKNEYKKLKIVHPDKSDVWIAKKISQSSDGQGRSPGAIRRIMTK